MTIQQRIEAAVRLHLQQHHQDDGGDEVLGNMINNLRAMIINYSQNLSRLESLQTGNDTEYYLNEVKSGLSNLQERASLLLALVQRSSSTSLSLKEQLTQLITALASCCTTVQGKLDNLATSVSNVQKSVSSVKQGTDANRCLFAALLLRRSV